MKGQIDMDNNRQIEFSSTDKEPAYMLDKTLWSRVFSWNQISIISSFMSAYKAAKGVIIFEEGDSEQSMSIIISGTIDIIKMTKNNWLIY